MTSPFVFIIWGKMRIMNSYFLEDFRLRESSRKMHSYQGKYKSKIQFSALNKEKTEIFKEKCITRLLTERIRKDREQRKGWDNVYR